jgi:hypothetical protein
MSIATAVRRCLVDLDVPGIRAIWAKISPHLPQPKTDGEALAALHAARTASESVPLRMRAYSHRWLTERQLPSQLPDRLKPSAEQICPRVATSVGIAVGSPIPVVRDCIRGAMEYAVHDCYANGDTDPAIVKPQMMEARRKERKALGIIERGE